ncbi:MAG: hypothetical protein HYV26_05425, partial [Candidatus Hydrogenedentes bacterium]|nr:hypothetical protein [Candidatus Hydrogenedentota bacterium]
MPTTIAQEPALDLFHAVVVAPSGLSTPENKAVEMLVEEVAARSLARWTVQQEWPADDVPVVAVGPADKLSTFAPRFATEVIGGAGKPEGYRLKSVGGRAAASVLVVGDDARGVLFGCGRLLREMLMTREAVQAPAGIDITDAPKMATRGHQLGFRPKVNSYDGWTPVLWEQYYRDLIVFGTNAVELIPPRSDDDAESPHFPLPKIDMMVEMSQLAKDYGLDLWIWYPAMDRDYADPATVESALKEWGEVFQRLPHISTIFVPGGDPGHTHPEALFNLLAKQTENLHQYHPNAQMWMSPQSFNPEWMEVFYGLMQAEPQWLGGIVYGPQNRVSLPELREKIPAKYPIREYPDITHSLACQYAVPEWDPAYALTENREVINPRPTQYAHIFRDCDDYAHGVITYSEGCNDDVNKIVWSSLAWDPDADVVDVLRAYARYFIGAEYEESFAQGLLALEQNWVGPLLTNANVDTTLQQFEGLLEGASPQVKLKWRFQQAIYRAYYDAYNRRRLLYETALEQQA